MITPGKALGWTRGLRFRLALSYVIFFSVLLVLLGMLFRQILSGTFQAQMESVLDEEWGAAKGYLRTGPEGPNWIYDEKDPGRKLHRPPRAARLPAGRYRKATCCSTPRSTIRSASIRRLRFGPSWQSGKPAIRVRTDPSGVPYMIRSGLWVDHDGHKYYLAIGRAIDYNDKVISDFTWNYFRLGAAGDRAQRRSGLVPGGPRARAGEFGGRGRAAHHALQSRCADSRCATPATNWTA